jgi:hypothetical protein
MKRCVALCLLGKILCYNFFPISKYSYKFIRFLLNSFIIKYVPESQKNLAILKMVSYPNCSNRDNKFQFSLASVLQVWIFSRGSSICEDMVDSKISIQIPKAVTSDKCPKMKRDALGKKTAFSQPSLFTFERSSYDVTSLKI